MIYIQILPSILRHLEYFNERARNCGSRAHASEIFGSNFIIYFFDDQSLDKTSILPTYPCTALCVLRFVKMKARESTSRRLLSSLILPHPLSHPPPQPPTAWGHRGPCPFLAGAVVGSPGEGAVAVGPHMGVLMALSVRRSRRFAMLPRWPKSPSGRSRRRWRRMRSPGQSAGTSSWASQDSGKARVPSAKRSRGLHRKWTAKRKASFP